MRLFPLLLLVLVPLSGCNDSEPAVPAKAAEPAKPAVPGALSEAQISVFIEIQTIYMEGPDRVKKLGLTGMQAQAEMNREREEALLRHGFTHQTWGELYTRIRDAMRRADRGNVMAMTPVMEADNEIVAKYRDTLEAVIFHK